MTPSSFRYEFFLSLAFFIVVINTKLNFSSGSKIWIVPSCYASSEKVTLPIITKSLNFRIGKDIGKSAKYYNLFVVLNIIAQHVSQFVASAVT